MIASDPLSYLFLSCFVFSGLFLIISTMLGVGHGHIGVGGHGLHLPHPGSGHAAPTHVATAHPISPHPSIQGGTSTTNATTSASPLASLRSLFLGSLNLYGLLILLLIFGLLGYLLHNYTNIGAELSLLLAILAGVGSALLISSLLSTLFFDREVGVLGADSSQLEGRLGKISMSIRVNGIGEVIYTNTQGSRQSMGARSVDGGAIPSGTDIVILGSTGGIASVQTWDRFIADVHGGNTPRLEPLETE